VIPDVVEFPTEREHARFGTQHEPLSDRQVPVVGSRAIGGVGSFVAKGTNGSLGKGCRIELLKDAFWTGIRIPHDLWPRGVGAAADINAGVGGKAGLERRAGLERADAADFQLSSTHPAGLNPSRFPTEGIR
jgi:hypothetical protein